MTQPYPISEQRPLDGPSRRKLLGMNIGGRSRAGDELPRPSAHEVLVYRVGGQYRKDNGFGLSHEDVVQASHVSVVDMSRDRPVVVEFPIPSRDAEDFQVRATFLCTVTDEITVVREGIDAESGLLGYVKSHHKVLHLGLGYPLAEINDVRVDVEAEITALATIRPPALPGMLIALASVEVATPAELAAFHQKVRGLKQTHTLDSLQQGYTQDLDQTRLEYDNEKAAAQQQHEQQLASKSLRHEQLLAVEGHQHDQQLDRTRRQYENEMAIEQQGHNQLVEQARRQFQNALDYAQQQHDQLLKIESQRYESTLDADRLKYENAKAVTQMQQDHLLALEDHRHGLTLDAESTKYNNAKAVTQQLHDQRLAVEGRHHEQELDQTRRQYENEMAIEQQGHNQLVEQARRQFENTLAHAQQQHDQQLAMESHRHELSVREVTSEHALRELGEAQRVIGSDPLLALQYAFQAGEINASDYAAGVQADADRKYADGQRQLDQDRADERRRADQAHEERMLQMREDHEAQLRAAKKADEDQAFIRAIKVEMLRDLVKKGYLDMVDPEAYATELLGDLTSGGEATRQLPSADSQDDRVESQGEGPSVREEDGD
jgi:hypothetical protein